MPAPGRPHSTCHDIVVYTRAPTCLNRSMTDNDFQRIQELLTTSLNATEARNAEHFDSINKRLDGMEKRLDKLEHEIKDVRCEMKDVRSEVKDLRTAMEEGFDAIGAHFNEIDNRSTKLDEKIDRNHQEVTKRIDTLSKDIETQHEDALQAQGALKLLTTQHEQLAGRVAIIESRLQAA